MTDVLCGERVVEALEPNVERVRTHMTAAGLRLDLYARSGNPRDIAKAVLALGKAFTAAILERIRADQHADKQARRAA